MINMVRAIYIINSRMYFITVLVLLFVFLPLKARASPNFLSTHCPRTTTYSSNSSTYEANLNTIFSVLSSNSVNSLYNATVAGYNPPDIAHGLYLCRGDLSPQLCHDCVVTATTEILERCPYRREVTVWYDECMLRYSNKSISQILDKSIAVSISSFNRVIDSGRAFREVLGNVLIGIAADASTDKGGKKFATRQGRYKPSKTLYGLAQCTPDLTSLECNACLQEAISMRHFNRSNSFIGLQILFPSCNIRYEIYPFYDITAASRIPQPVPSLSPPNSPTRRQQHGGDVRKRNIIDIAASLSVFVALILFSYYVYCKRRRRRTQRGKRVNRGVHLLGRSCGQDFLGQESTESTQGFPSIKLDIIFSATNQFSFKNKLGQGGFGPVYKGILPDGKAIAVKRLSRTSGQGLQEFRNEISLIARLQHRNLVRLLGCCLEGNELLLIYEYMPNKSLDFFIFGSNRGAELDWTRRFIIIKGIARGILYLHEDSRLRIIHRDLKASNVLLDREMNPKISDFGLARIFGLDQAEANTDRVVGTFGYMAPEYAMEGLFSVKSDVFSFGVLLLEIISGKKNSGFYVYERGHNLLSFTWELWSQGRGLELLDPVLKESSVADQVLKCIHIGLLCVQDDPADRPTMSLVAVMLASDTMILPQPTKPTFPVGRKVLGSLEPSPNVGVESVNEITVSTISPR